MKQRIFALLMSLFLLTACGNETIPAETAELPPETAEETQPAEPEPVLYAAVEDLLGADGIISVEKAEIELPPEVDISIIPAEMQEMYREMQETNRRIAEFAAYQVLYTVDDCTVSAFIAVPPDYLEETRPLLLYNRGGNANFSPNTAGGIAGFAFYTDCVVIASNYRETEPGTGKDEFGGADVNDVVFWMELAEELGFVDRERVYMVGESRGGMQTCLALLEDEENIIRAAACISGVYDVAHTYESRGDMREMLTYRIGGTPEDCPEEYAKRSAVTFAEKIDTPLLLIHSTGDERVPYEQAVAFSEELKKYGKPYEFITREDNIHSMSSPTELQEIIAWMEENAD